MAAVSKRTFPIRLGTITGKDNIKAINGLSPVPITYQQLVAEDGVSSACERIWSEAFKSIETQLDPNSRVVLAFTCGEDLRTKKFPRNKENIKLAVDDAIASSKNNTGGECNTCFELDCPGRDHGIVVYYCFNSKALMKLCGKLYFDLRYNSSDGSFSVSNFVTTEQDTTDSSIDPLERLALLPSRLIEQKFTTILATGTTYAGSEVDIYTFEGPFAVCRFQTSPENVLIPLSHLRIHPRSSKQKEAKTVIPTKRTPSSDRSDARKTKKHKAGNVTAKDTDNVHAIPRAAVGLKDTTAIGKPGYPGTLNSSVLSTSGTLVSEDTQAAPHTPSISVLANQPSSGGNTGSSTKNKFSNGLGTTPNASAYRATTPQSFFMPEMSPAKGSAKHGQKNAKKPAQPPPSLSTIAPVPASSTNTGTLLARSSARKAPMHLSRGDDDSSALSCAHCPSGPPIYSIEFMMQCQIVKCPNGTLYYREHVSLMKYSPKPVSKFICRYCQKYATASEKNAWALQA